MNFVACTYAFTTTAFAQPVGEAAEGMQILESPGRLHRMAPWSARLDREEWPAESVLVTTLDDTELAFGIGAFCFMLEEEFPQLSRTASNEGGWQSNDISGFPDASLEKLVNLLHGPLVAFLRKGLGGRLPSRLRGDKHVAVAAVMHEFWVNINRVGDWNVPHEHGPPDNSHVASGIYYPMSDSIGGALGKIASKAKVRFLYEHQRVDIAPRVGEILLFPPALWHEVEPMPPGENVRLSLAFNLHVRWLDRPILRAAIAGKAKQVAKLVEQGAHVEEADGVLGFRAMHLAGEAGHTLVIDTLLRLGASASALSSEGWSPLGLAAARGHTAVIQRLGGGHAARLVTPLLCNVLKGHWHVTSLSDVPTCCLPQSMNFSYSASNADACDRQRDQLD